LDDALVCLKICCVFLDGFLLLHAGAGENLLFLPRQESSSLSESRRELPFAPMRAVSPKRDGLA